MSVGTVGPVLTHIVLITTSADATDEQIEAALAALRALPEQIEAIAGYDVGRDLGLAEGNATIAVRATFASPTDLDAYIAHPAHQQVVTGLIGPIAAAVTRAQVGEL